MEFSELYRTIYRKYLKHFKNKENMAEMGVGVYLQSTPTKLRKIMPLGLELHCR